jgi:hypothetical protein
MDWKVRQNFRKGSKAELGHQILHFREAFHGRTGYTVSMTNTADPRKHQYFAKFDWPRVSNPHLRFPVDAAELDRVQKAETATLAEIRAAFAARKDDIAAILLEPIQAEGGDHHFRTEFLVALKAIAHEHDALLIFDEVQTGVGLTGRFWAHEGLGVQPDLLAFGKKMQVCGMLGGGRIDDEPDNVFKVSSRINSTWGERRKRGCTSAGQAAGTGDRDAGRDLECPRPWLDVCHRPAGHRHAQPCRGQGLRAGPDDPGLRPPLPALPSATRHHDRRDRRSARADPEVRGTFSRPQRLEALEHTVGTPSAVAECDNPRARHAHAWRAVA